MALPLGSGEAEIRAFLDGHGVDAVKTMLNSGGLPTTFNAVAYRWIGEKEQEAEQQRSAAEGRIAAAAERQATAAEAQPAEAQRANKRASIAIAIAIASLLSNAALTVILFVISH